MAHLSIAAIKILCSDYPNSGRVDPSLLSDQQRMELLFEPDDYEASREQLKGDEDDACTWKRTECDENGRVTSISWHSSFLRLHGKIDMALLPLKLRKINLYFQPLRGDVNTSALPVNLGVLCIHHTDLSGTLDVSNLPKELTEFVVKENKITAVGDIVNLPQTIQFFTIGEKNIVERRVRIGPLPEGLLSFRIRACGFTDIDLDNPSDRRSVN